MQITEITIHPTNERLCRRLSEHCLRQLFDVGEIRGHPRSHRTCSSHFLPRSKGTVAFRQLAYPANVETRMMFQRVILAEYEKLVGEVEPVPSVAQLLNV